ncbi:hypothetical protein CHS0354_023391 [Potamilus streckersoni]|uniref:Uncharacterized protein n=1 Tax=Potamilus streckersoni TaxID=2493646 RepID=A0AAE0T4Q3_9BIVA|nr:hypothetical protein CHS0354_023391 [Potamilus streckersoni]
MSVILTACRNSKQRAIEKALKKRAEKVRLKREAQLQQLENQAFLPSSTDGAVSKAWSFTIDSEVYNVIYFMDSCEVICNDSVVDVMSNFDDQSSIHDFVLGSSFKARIKSTYNPLQGGPVIHTLTIDGNPVPE